MLGGYGELTKPNLEIACSCSRRVSPPCLPYLEELALQSKYLWSSRAHPLGDVPPGAKFWRIPLLLAQPTTLPWDSQRQAGQTTAAVWPMVESGSCLNTGC